MAGTAFAQTPNGCPAIKSNTMTFGEPPSELLFSIQLFGPNNIWLLCNVQQCNGMRLSQWLRELL